MTVEGSKTLIIEERNGKHRVRVWDSDLCRKVTVGTYSTKKNAERAGRKAERELELCGFVQKRQDTTFGALCDEYLTQNTTLRPSTRNWYVSALKPARKHFGENHSVRRLTKQEVQKYVNALVKSGKADKTVHDYIRALAATLGHGVDAGYLLANPAHDLKHMPKNKRREERLVVLTVREHEGLVAAAPKGYRTMIAIWPYVGLRRSEMQGLTWAEVDLKRGELHVRYQLREDGTLDPALKTEKSRRTVDLTPYVVAELKAWKLACPHTEQGFVFPTPRGLPQKCKPQFYKVWNRMCEDAGIVGLTSHGLRHTFASWNLAAGEDAAWVSEQMGHTNLAMTLNTYTHVVEAPRKQDKRKLDEWLEKQGAVA